MLERDGESPIEGTTPKLVMIEWHDSQSYSAPWKRATALSDGLRKHGQDIIRSTGWLVDETEDYVLMCADLAYEMDDGASISMVGRAHTIPKGCIIRRVTVRDPFGISPLSAPKKKRKR